MATSIPEFGEVQKILRRWVGVNSPMVEMPIQPVAIAADVAAPGAFMCFYRGRAAAALKIGTVGIGIDRMTSSSKDVFLEITDLQVQTGDVSVDVRMLNNFDPTGGWTQSAALPTARAHDTGLIQGVAVADDVRTAGIVSGSLLMTSFYIPDTTAWHSIPGTFQVQQEGALAVVNSNVDLILRVAGKIRVLSR